MVGDRAGGWWETGQGDGGRQGGGMVGDRAGGWWETGWGGWWDTGRGGGDGGRQGGGMVGDRAGGWWETGRGDGGRQGGGMVGDKGKEAIHYKMLHFYIRGSSPSAMPCVHASYCAIHSLIRWGKYLV